MKMLHNAVENFDRVALGCALTASAATFLYLNTAGRPFPPGIPEPSTQSEGGPWWLRALMGHAYSNKYNKQSLVMHEKGYALAFVPEGAGAEEARAMEERKRARRKQKKKNMFDSSSDEDEETIARRKRKAAGLADVPAGSCGVYGLRYFHQQRWVVSNKDDVEEILLTPSIWKKGAAYRTFLEPVLGRGLLSILDDTEHSAHRAVCNRAFGPHALTKICNTTMVNHAMELLRTLQTEVTKNNNDSPSVKRMMHRTALNIVAEAAFRTNQAELEAHGFEQDIDKLFHNGFAIEVLLPGVRQLPLRRQKIARNAKAAVNRFASSIIDTVKKEVDQMPDADRMAFIEEGKGKALLDYLVLEKDFTRQQVLDHALTFMFAGHETSSNTLEWAMVLLATHPNVQQTLFEELCELIPLDAAPDMNSMAHGSNCEYLNAIINETLRLYPIVPVLGRVATEDTVLRHTKQFIAKGAAIQLNVFNIHRSEAIYGSNAHEFYPERWMERRTLLDGDTELILSDRHLGKCGFMPFSVGGRSCIGKEFAMNEIRVILAVILRNFELRWPEGQPFPHRRVAITMAPREDAKIVFVPRK